jgi:hypothetical protein
LRQAQRLGAIRRCLHLKAGRFQDVLNSGALRLSVIYEENGGAGGVHELQEYLAGYTSSACFDRWKGGRARQRTKQD